MNGVISDKGYLHIERAGNMKQMDCVNDALECSCGDRCVMFGEPKPFDNGNEALLEICQGRILRFKNLVDHRRKS